MMEILLEQLMACKLELKWVNLTIELLVDLLAERLVEMKVHKLE